jgi:hypothetical protein
MVTRRRASGSVGRPARRFSPALPGSAGADATSASSEPCSASHFAAVFGPTPLMPGMLSEVSPIRARYSTICAGATPNFSFTAAASSVRFFMVSSSATPWPTSCAMSLSPVTISTGMPARRAWRVSVPMTSSASSPGSCSSGRPIASTHSLTCGNCAERSSGVASRVALYSA